MKKWVGITIVSVLVGLFLWNVLNEEKPTSTVQGDEEPANTEQLEDNATSNKVNQQTERQMIATDFELPTLAGDSMRLSDTRGKITILNFWASWCEPCKLEAPHLQKFYEENHERVEIIAVNMTHEDSAKKAQAFVEEYGLTFPVLLDETGEVSTMYGAFTIPTSIFLNEKGEIVQQFVGPMEEEFLLVIVDSI